MASYTLNEDAVRHAETLIKARQYVLDSDWGEAQPNAGGENAYLDKRSGRSTESWHLGLTDGAPMRRKRSTRSCSAICGACTARV